MTYVLVAVLCLATGWTAGHRTARIVRVPVGALSEQDDEALMIQAIRDLHDACCDAWWTSTGQAHDPTCPNHRRSAAA